MAKNTSGTLGDRWSYRPPKDIKRMMERAGRKNSGENWLQIQGVLSFCISKALRLGLTQMGHARKRDEESKGGDK